MSNTYEIIAGLDIGNGYVKGKCQINGGAAKLVDMPSCVSYISATSWLPVEPDDKFMADLFNELDCDISSPAIPPQESMRLIYGRRAVDSGNTSVMFNIDDSTPKCEDPLSMQLALGVLASLAAGAYWEEHRELPADKLNVVAKVGVALPITDFKQYRDVYRRKFETGVHTVIIRNFERVITVDVTFEQVTVLAEGAAAQFAITDLGAKFLDAALAASKAAGLPVDEEESGETLLSYMNTIGIDIGEGTVNYPCFRDGKVSADLSSSINKGYGTALSRVVAQVRNQAYAPQSRKDLAEFMLKPNPNARDRKLMAKLESIIDSEIHVLVHDIIAEYTSVLSKMKLQADVVYVYGGGANAVRHILYPELIKASRLDEDIYMPVIYLDSAYSRDLNRNGLYMVAKSTDNARKAKAAQQPKQVQ